MYVYIVISLCWRRFVYVALGVNEPFEHYYSLLNHAALCICPNVWDFSFSSNGNENPFSIVVFFDKFRNLYEALLVYVAQVYWDSL